jgi:hypothetical protein
MEIIDTLDLKEEIKKALKDGMNAVLSVDLEDLMEDLDDIADKLALYASRKALGEDVTENMVSVRNRAGIVGAIILRRYSREASRAWDAVLEVLITILGGIIKKAIA